MPELSIIVPVYNMENYLNRCVESILSQTFKDFELILVNDGSVDNSKSICDKYAVVDQRVKVVHKQNGGQSSARNIGLDMATGTYIGFVDSDDWIASDMYEHMVDIIKETQSDAAQIELSSTTGQIQTQKVTPTPRVFENREIERYFLLNGIKTSSYGVCRYLYKRKLWDGIRFAEGKIHEDIIPNYHVLSRASKLVISDKIAYFYYVGGSSTTRTGLKLRDFDLLDVCEELCSITAHVDYKDIHYLARVKKARSYFSLLAKMAFYGLEDRELHRKRIVQCLTKKLRQNYFLLMKSPISTNRKLMVTTACIHLGLLELPINLYRKIAVN